MTERSGGVPRGTLSVHVPSESLFLGQAIPIEVRDSGLRLVNRAASERTFDLPEGLYEVSAVLEDGRRHSTLVQVKGGERTPVELAAEPEAVAPSGVPEPEEPSRPRYQRPRFTRSMAAALGTAAEEGLDTAADVQLLEVHGAALTRETRTLRIFQCAPHVDAVPTALFQIGPRRLRISLPISPQQWSPSGSCAVKVERSPTGVHAHAWIAPERTVANALQNMLSSGYLLHAARVADDAVGLLRDKYEDPAGAALGALLLYKTGRLQRWESWVSNLARDFDWLPDGKVLLAQLRFEQGDDADAVLGLALKASQQRMLYAESYSLVLDLLRRWPRETSRAARQEAIERLAGDSPYIDWEPVCLSQWLPDGEE
jgi:hypothetical protein